MAFTLKVGESKTIQLYREEQTANGVGVGPVNAEVLWDSSDVLVATVSSGMSMGQGSATSSATITAIWLGTATITATAADGAVDTITVHVTELESAPVSIGF